MLGRPLPFACDRHGFQAHNAYANGLPPSIANKHLPYTNNPFGPLPQSPATIDRTPSPLATLSASPFRRKPQCLTLSPPPSPSTAHSLRVSAYVMYMLRYASVYMRGVYMLAWLCRVQSPGVPYALLTLPCLSGHSQRLSFALTLASPSPHVSALPLSPLFPIETTLALCEIFPNCLRPDPSLFVLGIRSLSVPLSLSFHLSHSLFPFHAHPINYKKSTRPCDR